MPSPDHSKHSKALRPDWRVLACAIAIAVATGVAFFVFADASPGGHPSAGRLQSPSALPVASASVPAPDSSPALGRESPAAASGPVVSARAKAFPPVVLDASAEVLYQRLARIDVTLDQAGEVAKLHKALERCWMASFHERMAQWASSDSDPQEHAIAQVLARQEREQARPGCGELPEDAYARADEWTARLAARGDPQSMMDYGDSYWSRDLKNVMRDPERLAQFRRTTLMYLNDLIDQGYTDALIAMASIRYNPTWGEPQPAEVWAYLYANAKARGNVSSQANLLQGIDQRVPPEGRQRAMDMAQELLQRCCGG